MGFWRIVITIIFLPPLGVLLGKGFGWRSLLDSATPLLSRFDSRVLGANPRLKLVLIPRGVNAPRLLATLSECFR